MTKTPFVCALTVTFAGFGVACGQSGTTSSGTTSGGGSPGTGGAAATTTTATGTGGETTSTTGAGGTGGAMTTTTTTTAGTGGAATTTTTTGVGGGTTTTATTSGVGGAGGAGTGGAGTGGMGGAGGMGMACASVNDCPVPPNECVVRNCIGGVCGTFNLPNSLLASAQTDGDCKVNKCSGMGTIVSVIDNADVPIDNKPCTMDVCTNGAPSNPKLAAGASCGQGTFCDAAGNCSGCTLATDCAGSDGPCQTRTCTNGLCGVNFAAAGTPAGMQAAGDCKLSQCNGMGAIIAGNDDQDVPVDGKSCTADVCTMGMPSNPPAAAGTACNQNGGTVCDAGGVCTVSFTVVRMGDGAAALTSAATPIFLEQRTLDGTLIPKANNPLALPVVPSGNNRAITSAGSSTAEGNLSLSPSGVYLTLAGYDAAVGTAAVAGTASMTVNRIIARVDAAGNVDTSTRINNAFSGGNIRSAATGGGGDFWASGSTSGVQYIQLGALGSTQILAAPSNGRFCHVQLGQLYCTSGTANFNTAYLVGAGTPTMAGQTASLLPGIMLVAAASPYSFVFFDRNAAVPGVDTLYLADDRAAPNGGVQKWTFDGAAWSLITTFNDTLGGSVRGLAGFVSGANVVLIATTSSKIGVFTDDGSMSPVGTIIATAAANTAYRGVALSPK